ncbi:LPXTG cell wall anchor domain-containing protein [Herbiconiux solani]|uniref:LPXTG cell wall anchor domain-containing protein n=1 Tax=Herbiconiux solani TaxID=661329 RepID=UPI001470E25F|nr:LPXTG cell wall anchor domain-containing protein [Herbiconiux solani]
MTLAATSHAAADLAATGANGQLALIIGGIAVAVLIIGGIVLLVTRRRRNGN